jgi:hypothetical protein
LTCGFSASYLLDTSILSIFAHGKPPVATNVERWMRENAGKFLIPTVAFLEIDRGIANSGALAALPVPTPHRPFRKCEAFRAFAGDCDQPAD